MVDLDADFAEFSAGLEGLPDPDDAPRPPEDPAGADRLLRALRACEIERDAYRSKRDEYIADAHAWYDDRTRGIENRIVWLERSLEGWARSNRKLTYNLPAGQLRLRGGTGSRLIVEDEEHALRALVRIERTDLIRTTSVVDKNAVKEVATVVDGRVVVPNSDGEEVPVDGLVLEGPDGERTFGYTTTKEKHDGIED